MNYSVETAESFERQAKPLIKRYASLKAELADLIASLVTNPTQGTNIGKGVTKFG